MIKVLHLTISSDIGGGPEHITQLVSGMSKKVENHIACPNNGPYFNTFSSITNCKVTLLPHRKFSFYYLFKIYSYVKINNINIIHSHGKGAGIYTKFLKLLLLPVILIHTPHGINQNIEKGIKNKLYLKFENLFKFLIDKIIYVSDSEYRYALKFNLWQDCKFSIIYNGTKSYSKYDLVGLKKLGNKYKTKTLITASRFDFQKNSIEFCLIAKELPNYHFIIIGDGYEKLNCIKYCQENKINNVEFVGLVSNPINFFSSSDLYLSTARWEGLSMAILESMALGLPIVATDVVGNTDLIFSGRNGYLYEIGNISQAVKLIEEILNVDNYMLFSKNSVEIHADLFSSVSMCNLTEQVYFDLYNYP
jgi:glycosyltransferase involved in cell wall biosynthesis